MARDKYIPKRELLPDEKFGNVNISKFINVMMGRGKKSIARKIMYDALDTMAEKAKKNSIEVFEGGLKNVMPLVEVKSRRVGGATYQIPVEVNEARGAALAMRWIVMFSRKRSEKTMSGRLAGEFVDAFNKNGNSFKKKDDTHKMAEANKAFSHFRW